MVTWSEAVVRVLEDRKGPLGIRDIYSSVVRIKKTDLDASSVKHRVRAALNDLRKDGDVEHVKEGVWRLVR